MKVTIAEAQLLADNKDVLPVVENLLQECLRRHMDKLMSLTTDTPESAHMLLVHKARLDGMKMLAKDFITLANQKIRQ